MTSFLELSDTRLRDFFESIGGRLRNDQSLFRLSTFVEEDKMSDVDPRPNRRSLLEAPEVGLSSGSDFRFGGVRIELFVIGGNMGWEEDFVDNRFDFLLCNVPLSLQFNVILEELQTNNSYNHIVYINHIREIKRRQRRSLFLLILYIRVVHGSDGPAGRVGSGDPWKILLYTRIERLDLKKYRTEIVTIKFQLLY